MLSLTRSCCQTVHLMPNCCGSVAQAHRDHWEVLEIVVATLKLGVHPWPLKIGIRRRSLARPKCVVEDGPEASASKMVSMGPISGSFPLWGSCHVQPFSREASCDCSLGISCVLVVMVVSASVVDVEGSLTSDLSQLPSF